MELNKIYCMDYLEGLRQLPDSSVDCIITDPPYCFETKGSGIAIEKCPQFKGLEEIGVDDKKNFINNELLSELLRITKKPNIFIFCNKAQILDILNFSKNRELCFEIIPLCKSAPIPFVNNQWLPDREWGIHLFKDLIVNGNMRTKKGFFIDSNYQQDKYDHPCVKPEYMIRRIISNLSKENDIILDCFMGSGTTAVVSKQLKRQFIGFEINPKYVDIANKRLSQQILQT